MSELIGPLPEPEGADQSEIEEQLAELDLGEDSYE